MTIKRLLGWLCLLVGIAIATSQTANAWQIQNNFLDGITIDCGNCGSFIRFSQKDVKLGEIVYCDGAEEGCRGDTAADGYGALVIIYLYAKNPSQPGCIMEIPDHIKPQGKIVFNANSYSVYNNEFDFFPTKTLQPYPSQLRSAYTCWEEAIQN